MGDPLHQVSESEFKTATSALKSKVHGTVILLHGFTRVASASKQQAQYFYSRSFNAVALNLSGHHLSPDHWPSLTLRESAGYTAVRNALKADVTVSPLIQLLNNIDVFGPKQKLFEAHAKLGGLMSTVSSSLKGSLSAERYETAQKAFALLDPKTAKEGVEKELHKFFATDLHCYESDPLAKLALLVALPGPIHIVGFSLGTAEAINLCARSNLVSKAVLLAPLLCDPRTLPKSDVAHFVNMAGSLDLFSTKVAQLSDEIVELPGRVYCAAMTAAAFLNREAISNTMRENTRSFCVLGQDDSIVDVPQSLEYWKKRLGSRAFVYPAELGIGHGLSPEVGNKFGFSLIEEIANYFILDEVNEDNLLVEKGQQDAH